MRLSATVAFIVCLLQVGCATVDVASTSQFKSYDRVAIWTNLDRTDEELFVPLYMNAFPSQTLVERRDVQAVIGEQGILPDRLDEATRARIRKILGVKAIVYPTATATQFAVKVIDTETGAIAASALVEGGTSWYGSTYTTRDRIREAIASLAK